MSNLIANALRYVGKHHAERPQVQVQVTSQERFVQVNVADNGSGLSPEMQMLVFDRFWRADVARSRDQGGSGLGLAICRAIVEAHGGRIWVKSQPGKGATFIFSLPTVPD
ncbi:MAG: ATP-binding protein [Chloroflexi bacterium]|nr:ATP-binding protein [Chloroflexota bacterium]